MSNFTISRRLENYQYTEGCPIFITGGNLLKENGTNNMFVNVRFRSISPKCISAVIFDIECFDVENEPLEGVTRYQLLDLKVKNGEIFGDKGIIRCPNQFTRKCNVIVKRVIFSDDTRWEFSDEDKTMTFGLQSRVRDMPSKNLIPVLINEMKSMDYPADKVIYIPNTFEYHWICTCGAINHFNRECSVCGMNKSKLFEIFNEQYLKDHESEYQQKHQAEEQERVRRRQIEEQRRAEDRRYQREVELKHRQLIDQEKEKQKSENKKTLYIVIGIAAVVFILVFFVYASSGSMDTNKDQYGSQTEYYDDYDDYDAYDYWDDNYNDYY